MFHYWWLFDSESLLLDFKMLTYAPATRWQNDSNVLVKKKILPRLIELRLKVGS